RRADVFSLRRQVVRHTVGREWFPPQVPAMTTPPCCGQIHRRTFLADFGMGFAGLALGAMLQRDGVARAAEPDGSPHHRPRAKSVIWIFLSGGYSHIETFDPKPALTKY